MTFDLDAAIAEAEGEPFEFTFGGEKYRLPYSPDLRAVAAMEQGKLTDAMRLLLGSEQWGRLLAADAVFNIPAFESLMAAYMKHCGLEPGESKASSPSSESTARPSKRTSNEPTELR